MVVYFLEFSIIFIIISFHVI